MLFLLKLCKLNFWTNIEEFRRAMTPRKTSICSKNNDYLNQTELENFKLIEAINKTNNFYVLLALKCVDISYFFTLMIY